MLLRDVIYEKVYTNTQTSCSIVVNHQNNVKLQAQYLLQTIEGTGNTQLEMIRHAAY